MRCLLNFWRGCANDKPQRIAIARSTVLQAIAFVMNADIASSDTSFAIQKIWVSAAIAYS
ncbi:hypothetical protein [Nostoc sp.]|uniref:hypothetical protein n=1 Tax=Nostoc sp. TaxID=1180 RepID=UPI002FF74DD0